MKAVAEERVRVSNERYEPADKNASYQNHNGDEELEQEAEELLLPFNVLHSESFLFHIRRFDV